MSHRPRNRQPRHNTNVSPRQQASGPAVPRHAQIRPNAAVSVVLKADQPTGRQVQGFVADVLTAGDHPRGVKVRLTDGRVGRVQMLASTAEAEAGTSDRPLGRDGDATADGLTGGSATASRIVYSDVRRDGHDYDYSASQEGKGAPSLEDYIVTKGPRRRRGKVNTPAAQNKSSDASPADADAPAQGSAVQRAEFASAKSTCPVCNAFEGDEAAVAHHVATHFE